MNLTELKAELSVKLLELSRAVDIGLPYFQIKAINSQIKELQFKIAMSDKDKADKQEAGEYDSPVE